MYTPSIRSYQPISRSGCQTRSLLAIEPLINYQPANIAHLVSQMEYFSDFFCHITLQVVNNRLLLRYVHLCIYFFCYIYQGMHILTNAELVRMSYCRFVALFYSLGLFTHTIDPRVYYTSRRTWYVGIEHVHTHRHMQIEHLKAQSQVKQSAKYIQSVHPATGNKNVRSPSWTLIVETASILSLSILLLTT